MPNKTAVMFPGQGSQYIGMGREFLDRDPEAAALLARAEEISGLPLKRLCLEGPEEELTRTLHLQPALTAVNLICWQALAKKGVRADYFVGHSLGEYAALSAAGVLTFEDTIKLVTHRGSLMEREAAANPGGMAAVVKLDIEAVREIVDHARAHGRLAVANHNSAAQVVISGDNAALAAAAEMVKEKGGKSIPLKVSGAWHSELIAGAVDDFSALLAELPVAAPQAPILFNVTAAPESDPAEIRAIMARQIAASVRWYEIVQRLLAEEVRCFIEVGPKNVLSGLLKKIIPADVECTVIQVDTPQGVEQLVAN
ncbi:ACP S-malonyltransferase [Desulfurivibrio alkaliphilus]|uniref:Malonyl CoA-acyl carrier protein transacylase n=1 Tax=Desulfurivibrio alkaliphilus (strain DSM 19089 / UNIQEM U267 / AHT2) TaxID=589865 RepID=D6Z2U9_DESAT|nr:ACP S-malonyltransferase [Desulfurivibrio alkaliphilus]ADH85874.1 malonyl CoA-acyl carrier protein transacylase [Desulfurivibrio alkaliphilus AHT 2]